jgi:hypothetical protein
MTWRADPNAVVAVELIDEAHDYDRLARIAPSKEQVEELRERAAKCREMAREITVGRMARA